MSSLMYEAIENGTGTFDNKKQFVFNNWSDEDFTFKWGGEPYTVKAGEPAVYPQYLAYIACKHFVDREMLKDGKEATFANKLQRQSYEDKTLREVRAGEENPITVSLREKIRAEVEADFRREMGLGSDNDAAVTSSETRRAKNAADAVKEEEKSIDDSKTEVTEFPGANLG